METNSYLRVKRDGNFVKQKIFLWLFCKYLKFNGNEQLIDNHHNKVKKKLRHKDYYLFIYKINLRFNSKARFCFFGTIFIFYDLNKI